MTDRNLPTALFAITAGVLLALWQADPVALDPAETAARPESARVAPVHPGLSATELSASATAGQAETTQPSGLPSARPTVAVEPDVIRQPYPLTNADLDRLGRTGLIRLPHPEGGAPLPVRLRARDARDGLEKLRISTGNAIGQVTRRGDRFFATLSTAEASYQITGGPEGTRILNQALLDQRALPGLSDARVPAA